MPTFNDLNTCNPTITFDTADVGKTFTITQTVTDPDGETDTFDREFSVTAAIVTAACEDKELVIDVADSYIANADFNDYTSLPEYYSQLDRVVGWEQFSGGTSDFLHEDGFNSGASSTVPSPDGGAYVGIVYNYSSQNSFEYVGQNLTTPIPSGSNILANFYAGGGSLSTNYLADGDRSVALYGIPNVVTTPVSGYNHIDTMGLGAVKLGEFKLNVEGTAWELASIEFIAPFDIKCLVFGGESTDTAGKYLCIDRLLVSEKTNFTCP
ncbi:hypothetical protein N9043_00755 [bacterium]|nr:hypothetical protein [bacterium]